MKLLKKASPLADGFNVRGRAAALLITLGATVLTLATAPGCNAPRAGKPAETAGSPVTETVVAEWNDVEASVRSAGFNSPAVFVMVERVSGRCEMYTLETAGDQKVALTAMRADDQNLTGITLSAKAGVFGNVGLERDVLDAVTKRLSELRGVKYRTLDGYK